MRTTSIERARSIDTAELPSAPVGARTAPSLLPHAEKPDPAQLQGSMAELYLAMSKMRDAMVGQANRQTDAAKAQRDAAAEAQQKALERAKEASEKGGFMDWIADGIGLGGAAGLVTFNYTLVAADLAVHKLGLLDELELDEKIDVVDVAAVATGRWDVLAADVILRKTELTPKEARDIVEKCGIPRDAPGISDDDIKPVAKKLLAANLLIASATATVLSCGTTGALCVAVAGMAISAAGTYVAQQNAVDKVFGEGSSKWIGLGMQIYGTAAACMSGFAGGAAIAPGNAARGAALAHGLTAGVRGTDQVVTAVHDHERDVANIDAEKARYQLARLDRVLDAIVDGMKELHQSQDKAAKTLQGAIDTANQTNLALAQGIKA